MVSTEVKPALSQQQQPTGNDLLLLRNTFY